MEDYAQFQRVVQDLERRLASVIIQASCWELESAQGMWQQATMRQQVVKQIANHGPTSGSLQWAKMSCLDRFRVAGF